MSKLYEKLKRYGKSGACPMHMPGHKRKVGLCAKLDITEIDGFDNLALPTGILKELSEEAARLYHADNAFLSVNGSTGAILAAICALCNRGDKIIMARNCHKSVYNAAQLAGLETVYIFPEYDENGIARGISPCEAKRAIKENPEARLVVLTSPTYEGRMSNLQEICNAAHKENIPVFVDAAHGAHIGFMGGKTPTECGADAAAVSLHKTLPAMTQTALLLVNGKRLSAKRIKEKMNVFTTSSPSYVLMASIAECLEYVQKQEKFKKYAKRLERFYDKAREFKNLKTIDEENHDKGKIVILTAETEISGCELMKRLRGEFKIELEMAYDNYALAMTSVCDKSRDLRRLYRALLKIDKEIKGGLPSKVSYPKPKRATGKIKGEVEFIPLQNALGRICADFVWAYPPGVPIIAKGEIIDGETIKYLSEIKDTRLFGSRGSNENEILVEKF